MSLQLPRLQIECGHEWKTCWKGEEINKQALEDSTAVSCRDPAGSMQQLFTLYQGVICCCSKPVEVDFPTCLNIVAYVFLVCMCVVYLSRFS